ncbi:MAG: Asp-tRNA(Asn)/Glu-tRNA(Gln) amidotransferase subunit GatB [Bacteroidota bacterium]|nr:Asp-tRNA(Asn)/Glu-tRNA(Gln) amidotransferase subunit GatB [Bacteroidota bacterium]
MASIYDKYQVVVGLEVHAQLSTKTKAYCNDSTVYGMPPNTQTSPISLGHPGTLPKSNKKVVEYAIKMGLACGSSIRERNEYARKNYFYPDLPKGYQITQDKTPICEGGKIMVKDSHGKDKVINITRIHMEEDAGKSIHDLDPFNSLIDLNRAGVALIEIVSEPDIRSADEAYQYLAQIRKLVRYLDVCDGNLEEGSLRCDANISVMPKGSSTFGNRTEIKNMNSLRNVKRAIEFEMKRQIDHIENGGIVDQETRTFNATDGTTNLMRSKEDANDYRYFPEPDLLPINISQEFIENIKKTLPPLPSELYKKFTGEYSLSEYDSNVLIEEKNIALYFNDLCQLVKNHKIAANIINGVVKSYLNEHAIDIDKLGICTQRMAELIQLIDEKKLSNSVATQKVFKKMIDSELSALDIAQKNNWIQDSNTDSIQLYAQKAIDKYPEKVKEYKDGKKGLLGLFMGEVMKQSRGQADPKVASQLIKKLLEN